MSRKKQVRKRRWEFLQVQRAACAEGQNPDDSHPETGYVSESKKLPKSIHIILITT